MRPNILVNILLGILLGVILGIAYVVLTYDSQKDKLFAIPRRADFQPHLVNTEEIKESVSVERAMEKMIKVPEIKELDDVPDLEKAEHQADKVIKIEELVDDKMELPDIKQELNKRIETPKYDISKKPEVEIPAQTQASTKEYPEFKDEDKFVGME